MAYAKKLSFVGGISSIFSGRLITHQSERDIDPSDFCDRFHHCTLVGPAGKVGALNGLITKTTRGQSTVRSTAHTLELRPWFWFLKQGTGCRVFQNKTVPEIVKAVAQEAGYADLKESLTATYPKLEYVVQYNESDFDFLSRLMEEAGIFYYFTHEKNKHTMVLADSPQGCAAGPELQWIGENFPDTPDTCIWNVGLEQSVQPSMTRVDDYNYLTPTASLLAKSGQGYPCEMEFGTGHSTQSDGETMASRRLDGFENSALELTAESSHSGLSAGMIFSMKGHPQSDLNKKWLITSLEMTIEESGRCRVKLWAIPGDKTFRPPRRHPRPRVFGPLTGVVCGKSGEEIWTDEHGRVKVRFHWDHKTKADENASAWLRVAQPWGGKGHGAFFLPRVGDEVLISFLGGDPDRPVVTGSVYSAAAKSPWPLPDQNTVSGFKGLSSPNPKDQGGNEISFDDKKDEERLYFHAQKLLEILVEEERRVTITGEGGDSLTLEKGGKSILIKKGGLTLTLDEGDRSVDLKKGGDTLKVKGDRTVTVDGAETCHTKKNLELKVDGNYTITIKGDLTIKANNIRLESDQALNAKSGAALEIKAGSALKAQSGTDAQVKAGTGLTLAGGTTFKLSGSAKGEVNGGGMLEVKGGLVKLN